MTQLAPHAKDILEKRYCMKNTKGERIEEAEGVFKRVAIAVAKAEPEDKRVEYEEKFTDLISSLRFMCNSPALSNAGARTGQLAACFVLPIEDSMDSILKAQMEMGQIQKTGGGTGFSFSRLRPGGDIVSSTNGVSSGPISFLKMFDGTSEAIKQGGTRRGANMGILRCDHPDIVEFIKCKEKEGNITNFNLSVGITDKFMEAVVQGNTQWELINPHTKSVWKTIDARELFNLIVHYAWKNGEPGVVFLDTINKVSPIRNEIELESTNPCGEQPLPPYDACNLGHVNVSAFVRGVGEDATFDFEGFAETTALAVRFLDDVIDVCKYPLPQITKMVKAYRRIGLGLMGFADALILMKIPYDSQKAFQFVNEVGSKFRETAWRTNLALGKERGAFPKQPDTLLKDEASLRNLAVTTIAPTGTCSLLADCSAGIEPLFAFSYERDVVGVGHMRIWNKAVAAVLKYLQVDTNGSNDAEIKKKLPDDWKRVLLTTLDISPANHVRIQGEFQKYIDSGISKTINMTNDATEEDVNNAFMLAYKTGCKSITVYRDGSRATQIIERDGANPRASEEGTAAVRVRPRIIQGYTEECPTGCGQMYVTLNSDKDGLREILVTSGKSGACISSWIESVARLVSIALRAGVSHEVIIKHLSGNRCQQFAFDGENKAVLSCSDAIAKAMKRWSDTHEDVTSGRSLALSQPLKKKEREEEVMGVPGFCPECSTKLIMQEGCLHCPACGYSKCT
jgi:ribonucleoside-diphosphate reductase alpha chain